VEVPGHALLRDARNREGATALLAFLARRRSAEVLATVGREIPTVVGAHYPPGLEDLRARLEHSSEIFTEDARSYAPKWYRFAFQDLYYRFFMTEDPSARSSLSVDDFMTELQRRTDDYRRRGGELGD
jgi:hypothetical protein